MKATEFVKKYGWESSIDAHKKNSWLESKYFDTRKIESWDGNDSIVRNGIDVLRKPFMRSLGELVNAYELVEKYRNTYGESARWFFIAEYCKEHRLAPHQSDVYDFVAAKYDSYVALAESCI